MQIDEEYFNNEEFKQKLRLFEDSVKSGHPIYLDDDDLTDIIDYYNLMNEGGKAMQTADFALSLYPSAPGPITYKIRRCIDANDISRAEELLEKVTDKEIDYKFLKAEILLSQEQPGLACHLLDEAIEAAEEDDRDNCVIDAIYLFMDYAYYELASKWLKRINNTRTEEYADLEIKVLGLLGEIDKVIEILNRLIDKNPFQHKYWNMISFAQLTNGNYNEALDSSDYSLAITPGNPGGLMCKAQALMKRFYFDEAVKYLYEYLKTYENDVNCLMQIGYCLMNMSKNDKALDIYLKAETKSSCDSEFIGSIYENIALAYSHTGNFEKAMEYIDKIEANCEDAESKHIKLLRGYAMLEAGRYKEGLFLLADLLVKADYDPADTLKVSVVLFENHCEKAAYTLMRDNFPLDDDTMVFGFAYYALYCLEVGEEEEYLKYLKIAVERNSDEAFMTLHHLFPEGMTPEEYYDYAIKKKNNN